MVSSRPHRIAGGRSQEDADLWVFAYGSLMWNPGFAYEARYRGHISGWRRRLCIWSHIYRGTPERPGLVLGLDQGGDCAGVAFRVASSFRATTLGYLRERELITNVYLEKNLSVALDIGEVVLAVTYVANQAHPQYAPPMPTVTALEIIKNSSGASGNNVEYVRNTYEHLLELGIIDEELGWLIGRIGSERDPEGIAPAL